MDRDVDDGVGSDDGRKITMYHRDGKTGTCPLRKISYTSRIMNGKRDLCRRVLGLYQICVAQTFGRFLLYVYGLYRVGFQISADC